MNPASSVHLAATWGLVGLIWTIQCVHYPLFSRVGRESFPAYHRSHTRLITWIVAPLMAAELLTAAALWMGPCSPLFFWSLPPLAFNWLSTACIQIPLHNRLARGFDARTHSLLVLSNIPRTLAWTARGILLACGALN